MSGGLLPNLIIPGVTKAGTTSLYAYLGQHPGICVAAHKEINHLAPLLYGRKPEAGVEAVTAHFAHCGAHPVRLDVSPQYLDGGQSMVEAVREHFPDARILVALRDPVTRLWSSYRYKQTRGRLPAAVSFSEFVDRSLALTASGEALRENQRLYRTLSIGFYVDHLGPWLDAYGDDLRVVFFEQLVTDPAAVTAEVCTWLGLDATPVAGFDFRGRNTTARTRSPGLARVADIFRSVIGPRLGPESQLKQVLRDTYERVNTEPDRRRLARVDRDRVAALYADANRRLADVLRERGYGSLPDWLTEVRA